MDFASTINRYTDLDAFPIPLIPEVLNELQSSRVFSRVDLRSATIMYYYAMSTKNAPLLKQMVACTSVHTSRSVLLTVSPSSVAFLAHYF